MSSRIRAAAIAAMVGALLAPSVLAAPLSLQTSALDELSWLAGEWQRETGNGLALERWRRTDAGLAGEGLVVRGGQARPLEALLLVEMAGETYYIAKPPENAYPVAFRLVSRTGGEFVFENTTHDFPQRITYRRTGENTMTASIEGPGESGAPQRIDFEFIRR